MVFKNPITIKEAVNNIQNQKFVLPAIQREFVWGAERICKLFDSLLRGYPISSFLFWKVEPETVKKFKFYGFVLNYHQRDAPHCPTLSLPGTHEVTAVLDGQQRLTSLYIGLVGSLAIKEPRKRWSNDEAFKKKGLYFNLLKEAKENEEGILFDFRFLTEEQAKYRDNDHYWFKVGKILDFDSPFEILNWLQEVKLSESKEALKRLSSLFQIIHKELSINYFEEPDQEIDKVLNIFIRINSSGLNLSYSDLLLSIATAQWKNRDARETIFQLVDELNHTGAGFSVTKDWVLKAGLMLCDVNSVGFKVTNFNAENMAKLEANWSDISKALKLSVCFVSDYGFSRDNLRSYSPLLVLAYNFYQRNLNGSFRTQKTFANDRKEIMRWFTKSLLKAGVWGSGLDTALTTIREVLKKSGATHFPVSEIELSMRPLGKSLVFDLEEIEDLADSSYSQKRTFVLLSLLFDFIDLKNQFHMDHVFPKSRFTPKRLSKAGVAESDIERYRDAFNRIANLQLLEGAKNISKSDAMPLAWLKGQEPKKTGQIHYTNKHLLSGLSDDMKDFLSFYDIRRAAIVGRLTSLLKQ